jgi:hypothetical protein
MATIAIRNTEGMPVSEERIRSKFHAIYSVIISTLELLATDNASMIDSKKVERPNALVIGANPQQMRNRLWCWPQFNQRTTSKSSINKARRHSNGNHNNQKPGSNTGQREQKRGQASLHLQLYRPRP